MGCIYSKRRGSFALNNQNKKYIIRFRDIHDYMNVYSCLIKEENIINDINLDTINKNYIVVYHNKTELETYLVEYEKNKKYYIIMYKEDKIYFNKNILVEYDLMY
jgi:hypothetical protein